MNKRSDGIFFLTDRYASITESIPFDGQDVELDLGCGDGDFAALLAARYPDRIILASDILLGRVRKVRNKSEQRALPNLKPLRAESRLLVSRLIPDASLTRMHLLCPDPWPKDKHRFRRFVTSDIMAHFSRVLKPGGIFHFSTDNVPYLGDVERIVMESGLFEPAGDEAIADIIDLKSGFEEQWLAEGLSVSHRAWRRIS